MMISERMRLRSDVMMLPRFVWSTRLAEDTTHGCAVGCL